MIRSTVLRKLIMVLATVVSLTYLTYRIGFTLNLTSPYATFASIFLLVGEGFGILSLMLYFFQIWEVKELPQQPVLEGRTVDVFVPTYNEDVQLLRATLSACVRMDYPHRTFLCDDGGTEQRLNDPDPKKAEAAQKRSAELKALCEELGVTYLTRPRNVHAKAGNMNSALEQTDGEFVIILDADHVPERHFITRLIGYFADEEIGYVQSPHAFYNFDSFQACHNHEKRSYWDEGQLFHSLVQVGRNKWGCPIFAGSAVMFRRKALQDVGYVATETITEDLHTGMRINAQGWKSMAVSERLIVGQAAPDVTTFHTQRLRWGAGNLSIMKFDHPFFMRGLSFPQRLCYFASMLNWTNGLFKAIIYLTPLMMLFSGVAPVKEFTATLGILTCTYLLTTLYALRATGGKHASFWKSELFNMIGFWTLIKASIQALLGRGTTTFVVTSKRGRQSKSIWPFIRPHVILIFATILALIWGWSGLITGIAFDWFKPTLATFWALFHLSLAVVAVRRSLWPEDHRFFYRHAVNLPIAWRQEGQPELQGVTMELSESGASFITYTPIEPGTRIDLSITCGSESFNSQAEVVWCKGAHQNGSPVAAQGAMSLCGLHFLDPDQAERDKLAVFTLQYAVPMSYHSYETNLSRSLSDTLRSRVGNRRVNPRVPVQVPVVIHAPEGDKQPQFSVTEDLSRKSFAAYLSQRPEPDSDHVFQLETPHGPIEGTAVLRRASELTISGQKLWRCVFEPTGFTGSGRSELYSLCSPQSKGGPGSGILPDRKSRPIPFRKPVLIGLALTVLMIFGHSILATYLHADDYFLRDTIAANGRGEWTPEKIRRVERIYSETVSARYPSSDRLLLLWGCLSEIDKSSRPTQMWDFLVETDQQFGQYRNLQSFMEAQGYRTNRLNPKQYHEFVSFVILPPEKQLEERLKTARHYARTGQIRQAVEVFDSLLELLPGNDNLRREYAGFLIAAGRSEQAEEVLEQSPADVESGKLRLSLMARNNDLPGMVRECETMLKLSSNHPSYEQLRGKLQRLQKNIRLTRGLYARLVKSNSGDRVAKSRLGLIALENREHVRAAQLFQPFILSGDAPIEVRKGYVDAVSSLPTIGAAERDALLVLTRRLGNATDWDVDQLTRLAWSLHRLEEGEKCAHVVELALAKGVSIPAQKEELVGIGLAHHEYDMLARYVDPITPLGIRIRASRLLREKKFSAAEELLRKHLKKRPKDLQAQFLLAESLAGQENYEEAMATLKQVRAVGEQEREVTERIAWIAYYSKQYGIALSHFEALLRNNLNQPNYWGGFIASASATETPLTATQVSLLADLADGDDIADSGDATLLVGLSWALFKADQKNLAESYVETALEKTDLTSSVRWDLAGVLAAMGEHRRAIQVATGLELTTERKLTLARWYVGAEDFTNAEKLYRELLTDDAGNRVIALELADTLSWSRNYPASLEVLNALPKQQDGDPAIQGRLAEVNLRAEKFSESLQLFTGILATGKQDLRSVSGFMEAASSVPTLTTEQKAMVVRVTDLLQSPSGESIRAKLQPELLARFSVALGHSGETRRARAWLETVSSGDVTDRDIKLAIASGWASIGEYDRSITMLGQIQLTDRQKLEVVGIYSATKAFDKAAALCRDVLDHCDVTLVPRARHVLAQNLAWKGEHEEALALYDQLIRINPTREVLRERARLLVWSRKYDEGLAALHVLLQDQPEDTTLWEDYVNAAASATKLSERHKPVSLGVADKVLAQNEVKAETLTRLSWVLRRLEEPKRAVALLRRSLKLEPANKSTRLQLAQTLYDLGEYTEANEYFRSLLEVSRGR